MGIGTVHTQGTVVFTHNTAESSFNVDGVTDRQVVTELQHRIASGAGQVNPSHISVVSISPMVSVTTTDIATVLDEINPKSGLGINSAGSAFTSCDAYFVNMANTSDRGGTGTHFRTRIVRGLTTLGTLTLDHQQDATLTFEIHAIYDGTNAPFQYVDNASLPHTASIDERFTLGKVVVNGTELQGVQRLTLNFGVTPEKLSGGGDLYTTFACIATAEPTIDIVTKEVPSLLDYTLTGTEVDSNTVIWYAKKYDDEGNHVANGTAEHIKFTATKGIIMPLTAGGGNNVSHDAGLRFVPVFDGSNAIIQIDTTSAIT